MVAPIINPYEPGMTKEERKKIWEPWVLRRKVMYFLARRFPKFLSSFYRRSFLSGKHDRIDRWLSLSLGKKVSSLFSSSKSLHGCSLFFPRISPRFYAVLSFDHTRQDMFVLMRLLLLPWVE